MGRDIVSSIALAVSPKAAIEAFLEIEALKGWWQVDRGLVQPQAGGVWTLAWDVSSAGARYVSSGIIETYLPGRRLVIAQLVYLNPERPILGPLRLEINAGPADGGCWLTVSETGYGTGDDWDWYYQAVEEGWPQALDQLKTFLAQQRKNEQGKENDEEQDKAGRS